MGPLLSFYRQMSTFKTHLKRHDKQIIVIEFLIFKRVAVNFLPDKDFKVLSYLTSGVNQHLILKDSKDLLTKLNLNPFTENS